MIKHRCTPGQWCAICDMNNGHKPRRVPLPTRGPCTHLGARVEFRPGCGGRMCRHECDAGEPVAVPGGVCQTCSKWESDTGEPTVDIGEPLSAPGGSRIVTTVAVGARGAEMLAATEPTMRRYAERVGADFLAVTGPPLNPRYPLGDKFRLHHLSARYDQLLFIDADALIHRTTPDLFALTPPGHVAIHDDTPQLAAPLAAQVVRIAASQGVSLPLPDRVLNSGVVLWSRGQPVWEPPAHPLPTSHVAEQCWVQANIERHALPVYALDRKWNHQWWSDRELRDLSGAYVLHLAGMGQSDLVPEWKLQPAACRTMLLRAVAWAA